MFLPFLLHLFSTVVEPYFIVLGAGQRNTANAQMTLSCSSRARRKSQKICEHPSSALFVVVFVLLCVQARKRETGRESGSMLDSSASVDV